MVTGQRLTMISTHQEQRVVMGATRVALTDQVLDNLDGLWGCIVFYKSAFLYSTSSTPYNLSPLPLARVHSFGLICQA